MLKVEYGVKDQSNRQINKSVYMICTIVGVYLSLYRQLQPMRPWLTRRPARMRENSPIYVLRILQM